MSRGRYYPLRWVLPLDIYREDLDLFIRPVVLRVAARGFDGLDDVQTLGDGAEDRVLAVEPWTRHGRDEPLQGAQCKGRKEGCGFAISVSVERQEGKKGEGEGGGHSSHLAAIGARSCISHGQQKGSVESHRAGYLLKKGARRSVCGRDVSSRIQQFVGRLLTSSSNSLPQMDVPPVPSPLGSPVWIMKLLMMLQVSVEGVGV